MPGHAQTTSDSSQVEIPQRTLQRGHEYHDHWQASCCGYMRAGPSAGHSRPPGAAPHPRGGPRARSRGATPGATFTTWTAPTGRRGHGRCAVGICWPRRHPHRRRDLADDDRRDGLRRSAASGHGCAAGPSSNLPRPPLLALTERPRTRAQLRRRRSPPAAAARRSCSPPTRLPR